MLKKILKIALAVLVTLIILVGVALAWVFSQSGNAFIKDKITQIINEKTQMGVNFQVFSLGWSELKIALTDKQNSTVTLQGNYSLLTLNAKAEINALINDLSPYAPLIGIPLNGGVQLQSNIEKQSTNIDIVANLQAFSSQISIQALLQDYAPKKLIINAPKGVNLSQLLHFLGQKPYISGLMLVSADLDISTPTKPQGGFKIASNNLLPNAKILKELGIIIPSDTLSLALVGNATQEAIISDLDIASSYLNASSKDFAINTKDFSTNGVINLSAVNFSVANFKIDTPLQLQTSLIAKSIASQNAQITLHWIKSPLVATLSLPHYQPKDVRVKWDDANLAEIIKSFKLPYNVAGNVNLDTQISQINLDKMTYTLKGSLTSLIQTLELQGLKIADNNALSIDFSGNAKEIIANLNSDLFNSKATATANIVEYTPQKAEIFVDNLNLQKLGALFDIPVNGNLQVKAEANDITTDKLTASFIAQSPSISLSKSALKKLTDLDFPQDLALSLQSEGALENGKGNAYVTLDHKDGKITLTDWKLDLQKPSYIGDFALDFTEVKNINPYNLKGAIKVSGSGGLDTDKPLLKASTKSFGGSLDINLQNERLIAEGKEIDLAKIAYFTNNEKIIKGGEINLNADLAVKLPKVMENLNGSFIAKADNMEIYSVDIDALANNLKNTQEIGLVDIGAFVVAGPLGLGASKGYDFGALGINSARSTQSVIKKLVLDLELKNGVAHTKDVALATGKTRIAARGGINLVKSTYEKFNIALLNTKGCATLQQQIGGSLSSPKIEATKAGIETVVNLATSILGKLKKGGEKVLTGQERCEIFYNGSVSAPQ